MGYRIRNYGKTPGILSEVSLGMGISPYPVDPVYSLILSSFAEHMIGGGDATSTKEFSYDSPLESSQADEIGRNISRLWFYGRIDYEDVFGNPQVHRFYFRTVMSERRCILQPYDHKHYNQSTLMQPKLCGHFGLCAITPRSRSIHPTDHRYLNISPSSAENASSVRSSRSGVTDT